MDNSYITGLAVFGLLSFILVLACFTEISDLQVEIETLNLQVENQKDKYYVLFGVTAGGEPYFNKYNATSNSWIGWVYLGGYMDEVLSWQVNGDVLVCVGADAIHTTLYYKVFNLTDNSVLVDYSEVGSMVYQQKP